jgi:predicted cation transporter
MTSQAAAAILLLLLLIGPVAVARIERNLEAWCLILGVIAATVARAWSLKLIFAAARAPAFITIAVIIAGILFGRSRPALDRGFARLRKKMSRPVLTAVSIILIGLLSSLITAIVAALLLIEAIGMLWLGPPSRTRVTVAGCFAIGLGSALTPAGGPFSAIVANGLGLRFFALYRLLGPWVIPGVVASGLLGARFARGDYDLIAEELSVREGARDALRQGVKVFAFVAGLALVSAAYAPFAARWIPQLGSTALFWGNTVSAALDNAALAAIEAHGLAGARVRPALLSMIISGGMLIPGNIPNIVCASALGIRSAEWGRIGIPVGLAMLGICFALFFVVR